MKEAVIEIKFLKTWKLVRMFPEKWPELTPAQLLAIAKASQSSIHDHELVSEMFGISRWLLKRLSDYDVYSLYNQLEFIGKFEPVDRFIIPKILNCYPPKPRLQDLAFGQFIFIDSYFNDYAQSQNPDVLAKFMAAAYTPPNKPFDQKTIAKRAAAMAKTNPHLKQAVAINYRLLTEWLSEAYPLMFSKPPTPDDSPTNANDIPKPAEIKKNKPSPWIKIYDSVVGDDIVNSERYAALPVSTVMRFLTGKIKESMRNRK